MAKFNYKAFVSYSWSDAKWGNWAHREIERFRTPKSLVGQDTPLGPVPRSLHPLFKDREEEAAGASISAAVEEALGSSEFLLVICSPRSARSKWVNYEIAWFKTNRDPSKILALIVGGEPGASKISGREHEECFPKALTHKVTENLEITGIEEDTPLAADARSSGDGKQAAKLKLVAAMLGVKLDELVRRDAKRRALRTRIVVTSSLVLAAFMTGLAWFAVEARNEARVQRDQAEGLVEYMISDLRENLQPKVQLEVLGGIADRANEYYMIQSDFTMDANALGRRSRVLKLLADLEADRGNADQSMELFGQSVEASAQLLELDPDNSQRILEHAYSLQGLGNAAFTRGDLPFAFAQMSSAVELLRGLSQRPDATEAWAAEYASATANLGIVHYQQRNLDMAVANLESAVAIKRKAASGADADWQDKFDYAITLAWMAKAKDANGDDAAAAQLLAEENTIYEAMIEADPDDGYAMAGQVANAVNRAEALLLSGQGNAALALASKTSAAAIRLRDADRDDMGNADRLARSQLILAKAELAAGNDAGAFNAVRRARGAVESLIAADPSRVSWSGDLNGMVRLIEVQTDAARSPGKQACMVALLPALAEAERLKKLSDANPAEVSLALVTSKALVLQGDYQMLAGEHAKAQSSWDAARERLSSAGGASGAPKDLASRHFLGEIDQRLRNAVTPSAKTGASGQTVAACANAS